MTIRHVAPGVIAFALVALANPAQAELKRGWIEYTHGSTKLKGYLAHDSSITSKRPAVLMLHAQEGMSEKTRQLADIWAKFGYVSFAADIYGYGEGILPKDAAEMRAQTTIYRKDRPLMRARAQAGYDALIKHALVDGSKVAAIGYCFGGAVGVEFGATGAPLALNTTIHGSFRGHEAGWAKSIKGRFLILHGANDKTAPITAVNGVIDELRAAAVPFQYELYSGAGHGFSAPRNKDEERANAQSIETAGRTLREVFGL